jgi:hypothetical protein
MAMFKCALVSPEAGAGGSEEGDIAGAADPHGLPVLVPDLVISNEPMDDLGHEAGFVFADKITIEFAVVVFVAVVYRDFETGDGRALGGSPAGRLERREAWLAGLLRQ